MWTCIILLKQHITFLLYRNGNKIVWTMFWIWWCSLFPPQTPRVLQVMAPHTMMPGIGPVWKYILKGVALQVYLVLGDDFHLHKSRICSHHWILKDKSAIQNLQVICTTVLQHVIRGIPHDSCSYSFHCHWILRGLPLLPLQCVNLGKHLYYITVYYM